MIHTNADYRAGAAVLSLAAALFGVAVLALIALPAASARTLPPCFAYGKDRVPQATRGTPAADLSLAAGQSSRSPEVRPTASRSSPAISTASRLYFTCSGEAVCPATFMLHAISLYRGLLCSRLCGSHTLVEFQSLSNSI